MEHPLPPPEHPETEPPAPPWAAGTDTRLAEMYPTLDSGQLAILCRDGTEERYVDGEWMWQVGEHNVPFYAVLEGGIDIVRRDVHGEHVIITHTPGQFSGEVSIISRRAALIAGRARGNLRAIALAPEKLRELMAVNPELGELLMQAFILRRMRMIAHHIGPLTLVGSRFSAETTALRDFLTRNGTPHEYIDLEQADDVQDLLEQFDLTPEDTPIVLCAGRVLRNPTIAAVAECLGIAPRITGETLWDVAVIGAGPGGLATAVYAASEGLAVIVIERVAPGGQAGTSSRIENYLGFPTGISGQALAGRAWTQAQKFGTEFALPRDVAKLSVDDAAELHITLASGERIRARTVVLASGVIYRRPDIPGIDRYIGSGVHYTASYLESLLVRDQEIAILGGGNSAGQAAVYLSRFARHVYILVRGRGLAESMSRYLIRRIETTANISLLTHTQISGVAGDESLTSVRWKNARTGEETERPVRHIFVFIGATPCTDFLDGSVARDAKGFIKTGTALLEDERTRYSALAGRQPKFFETSWPNVFAIGDVRSGSLKRVAAAVGEGSSVVSLVHEALQS